MSEKPGHQPLIIYADRGKYLKTNGVTFLLGAGLTFLAVTPWHHGRGFTKIFALLARVSLLIWGWFYTPILHWLLYPKPVVTVNDEGISYHPRALDPLHLEDRFPGMRSKRFTLAN